MRSFKVWMLLGSACIFALATTARAQHSTSATPQLMQPTAAPLTADDAAAAPTGLEAEEAPILQAAIGELDARCKSLTAKANALDPVAERHLLLSALSDAMVLNAHVEHQFEQLRGVERLPASDVVFFTAVRTRYQTARETVGQETPRFALASFHPHHRATGDPLEATLAALTYNEDIYRSYTLGIQGLFDLEVISYPAGAKITIWQDGTDAITYADSADTVINALPVSTWYVKAEYPGYEPIVETHDALANSNHKLVFNFTQEKLSTMAAK